ncbi:MarR family transcriptional regulator [Curtobacterium sp. ZW137]|uniref:MarR family transcriptional regulator n=1 Tax=Curtobacterium sp. ZW137 TaxID=2485104 RepID=UPI000F4C3E9D|nr:MarR family transcriptional regulator [Curtobacterium sp. ZW137]ROP58518.1 DNA-binding MarR family transcriptional regulator [Curtobacterium sp. ZW137]
MTDQDDERTRLEQRIGAMTTRFESEGLADIVEPLLSLRLTLQQLKVLTVLVTAEDGMTLTTLASSFGVSLASMSGVVDRLVEQDVVARTAAEGDQRVRRLRATARGRDAVGQLMARRPEYGLRVLRRLDLDDLRALDRGMSAVQRAVWPEGGERS